MYIPKTLFAFLWSVFNIYSLSKIYHDTASSQVSYSTTVDWFVLYIIIFIYVVSCYLILLAVKADIYHYQKD